MESPVVKNQLQKDVQIYVVSIKIIFNVKWGSILIYLILCG